VPEATRPNVTLDELIITPAERLCIYGALRATLDSIEEFRVTTSNAGADQGRSSGAQVALGTKSGGNDWHGTAYEYQPANEYVANDYFHKQAELQNGQPNIPLDFCAILSGGSFGRPD